MTSAPREEAVEVLGVRLRWRRAGSGPAVFLLHGMGATCWSFRHQLAPLAERFSVHAFDWPGYGRSGQPLDFDYSPAGYSRLLVAALDLLGLARAHLVGNSMGGLVALWTALHAPGRVERLVLLGAPLYPGDHPPLLWPLRWPVLGSLYEALIGPWAVPVIARSCFVDRSLVDEEMLAEYSYALRGRGGRHAVASFLRNALPPDPDAHTARYRTMTHPTLVVRGEGDRVVPRASVERFARENPRARLVHLPGVGHAPQEERPDLVTPLIRGFLEE